MSEFDNLLDQGLAALLRGDSTAALASLGAALQRAPDHGEALSLYGFALSRGGRFAEAEPFLRRAVKLEPDQAVFRIRLAEHYKAAKQNDEAAREFSAVPAGDPGYEHALVSLAGIHATQRAWAKFEGVGRDWVRFNPDNPAARRELSRALLEQGRLEEAAEQFSKAFAGPGAAASLCLYAQDCLANNKLDAAEVALGAAEKIDPNHPDMLASKTTLLVYRGRLEEAEVYCRRAIGANPGHARSYAFLVDLTGGKLSEAELSALAEVVGRNEDIHARIPAAFALAQVHDARGDLDAAFSAFRTANALCAARDRANGVRYDPAQREAHVHNVMQKFASASDLRAQVRPTSQPIFIVGMPRSGTTLIEAVLAAHSRVYGAGELPVMHRLLRRSARSALPPTASSVEQLAKLYVSELPETRDAAFVTDKHPLNFEAIGLIAQTFPDSPIIHVRRNPMETGLSIYQHPFSLDHPFASDLESIGHFYGQYGRLMAHWQRTLGERYITIQYEDFVSGFAHAAPELLAYCGLEWEESCRNFHSAKRDVRTLSVVQVRQPLSLRSGKAVAYETYLGPLARALEEQGVDVKTGLLREPL